MIAIASAEQIQLHRFDPAFLLALPPKRPSMAYICRCLSRTFGSYASSETTPISETRWRSEFIWEVDAARVALREPPTTHRPAAAPELEDFVECASKVSSAVTRGDFLRARWHARDLGGYALRLLIPLNRVRHVTDRRDALQATLALPIAPRVFREDLLACLGLLPLDDTALFAAAVRLARAMLAFLRERTPDIDAQPSLSRYVSDGTLERRLSS